MENLRVFIGGTRGKEVNSEILHSSVCMYLKSCLVLFGPQALQTICPRTKVPRHKDLTLTE